METLFGNSEKLSSSNSMFGTNGFIPLLLLLSLLLLLFFLFFKNTLKFFFYHTLFVVYISILTTFLPPMIRWIPSNPNNKLVYNGLVIVLKKSLGFTCEIRNEHNLSNVKDAAVLVANHQSMLDIIVMANLLSKLWIQFTLLVKKKTFPIWPTNVIATNVFGMTLVNNDGTTNEKIREDMQKMGQFAVRRKAKIIIFPEGTRNNSSKLLPFKKGAFKIAIENQIPVIPAVISPYYFINWDKRIFDKGHLIMDILEPVSTNGLTLNDLDDLIDKVRNVMSEKYSQLGEIVLQRPNKCR